MAALPPVQQNQTNKSLLTQDIIMKIQLGQCAPDFSLPSHRGSSVRLSDLRGKNVVLAFFPLAWTPI
jgi:peroxiredoxin